MWDLVTGNLDEPWVKPLVSWLRLRKHCDRYFIRSQRSSKCLDNRSVTGLIPLATSFDVMGYLGCCQHYWRRQWLDRFDYMFPQLYQQYLLLYCEGFPYRVPSLVLPFNIWSEDRENAKFSKTIYNSNIMFSDSKDLCRRASRFKSLLLTMSTASCWVV